ncbi:PTS transporter subunit EIIC [Austwickia chelonae]|uniref:PTS transporter subunit EIIC n=1 Tax=Austwickia chelonae TaxID=100225 RepID=UPI000E2548E9|nr:PTS transporter subunit EIIC [Austwickia chelonae]
MFKQLQRIGKSFMLPIAILPAAGLLLGIGGALSNPTTVTAYPALDNALLQGIFKVMNDAGAIVFTNLAILLSVGLCIGLAKRDKGTAALSGLVGYFVMTATIGALLKVFDPGGKPVDTGVVGSLAIGGVAVWLHNRYYNIQLPAFLGFFGGSRFVPIVTSFAAMGVGAVFFLVWPPVQQALIVSGESIASLGALGTFLYGFLLRLSGAVGLHHVVYPMFWYTPLGGTEMVAGQQVVGAQKIFFAQLADPAHAGLFTEGTKYFAGRFGTMMFGLPGAAFAMWRCVPAERRAKYTGLFFSVALTSFVTGITEPLEFMFLFVAPLLYVWHAFLDGVSFLAADLLSVRIGNTFSGGVIDFTLFGVLQGNDRTNWLLVVPFGVAWFFVYYFSFSVAIRRFGIATPGRFEEETDGGEVVGSGSGDVVEPGPGTSPLRQECEQIVSALGGAGNLESVDACITRLRVAVRRPDEVDKDALRTVGAAGVIEVAGGVQVVFGAKAIIYRNEIVEMLDLDD